jgi:DNA polymerase-4
LTALAWNRDPRHIETRRRARSADAQSALGRQPAIERVFKPTLHHLADRIGARLRAKSLAGRTITVRVRFADLRSVTRSLTLPAPISATRASSTVARDLDDACVRLRKSPPSTSPPFVRQNCGADRGS